MEEGTILVEVVTAKIKYSSVSYSNAYHEGNYDQISTETLDVAIADFDKIANSEYSLQWTKQVGRPRSEILLYLTAPVQAILRIRDKRGENISSKTKFEA